MIFIYLVEIVGFVLIFLTGYAILSYAENPAKPNYGWLIILLNFLIVLYFIFTCFCFLGQFPWPTQLLYFGLIVQASINLLIYYQTIKKEKSKEYGKYYLISVGSIILACLTMWFIGYLWLHSTMDFSNWKSGGVGI